MILYIILKICEKFLQNGKKLKFIPNMALFSEFVQTIHIVCRTTAQLKIHTAILNPIARLIVVAANSVSFWLYTAASVMGESMTDENPNLSDNACAFGTLNSENSYLAINLPLRVRALSTRERSVLNEQTI